MTRGGAGETTATMNELGETRPTMKGPEGLTAWKTTRTQRTKLKTVVDKAENGDERRTEQRTRRQQPETPPGSRKRGCGLASKIGTERFARANSSHAYPTKS